METLSAISLGLCRALRPLTLRLADSADDIPNLLEELGYRSDLVPPSTFDFLQTSCSFLLEKIDNVEAEVANTENGEDSSEMGMALGELAGALAATIAAIEILPQSLPAEAQDFDTRLYHTLLIRALSENASLAYAFLLFFGIIEDPVPGLESTTLYPAIYIDRIPKLFTDPPGLDRKSTRLNSSHHSISYAVF